MINLQKERFSNLNSSTVALKICDVIVRAARCGCDCSVTTRAIQIITTTPFKTAVFFQ